MKRTSALLGFAIAAVPAASSRAFAEGPCSSLELLQSDLRCQERNAGKPGTWHAVACATNADQEIDAECASDGEVGSGNFTALAALFVNTESFVSQMYQVSAVSCSQDRALLLNLIPLRRAIATLSGERLRRRTRNFELHVVGETVQLRSDSDASLTFTTEDADAVRETILVTDSGGNLSQIDRLVINKASGDARYTGHQIFRDRVCPIAGTGQSAFQRFPEEKIGELFLADHFLDDWRVAIQPESSAEGGAQVAASIAFSFNQLAPFSAGATDLVRWTDLLVNLLRSTGTTCVAGHDTCDTPGQLKPGKSTATDAMSAFRSGRFSATDALARELQAVYGVIPVKGQKDPDGKTFRVTFMRDPEAAPDYVPGFCGLKCDPRGLTPIRAGVEYTFEYPIKPFR